MPTYEYKCENGHTYTEVRPISSEQVTTICVEEGCESKLNRVYSAPPISFKGTGFHTTIG